MTLHDSKALRLQLLLDDLAPVVAGSREAALAFDLAVAPGETPKLWIDLITTVVMEPDHRTYRVIEDTANGRQVLHETANRAEMTEFIKQFMAHRIIERERAMAANANEPEVEGGYSTGALLLAWLAGVSFGALGLLSVALYLGII